MYNTKCALLFLLLITLFSSCKFDLFEDYEYTYPNIDIINIEQNFDTTYVDVKVTDNGDPVELIGISYQKDSAPNIDHFSQQIFGGTEGEFRIPLTALEPEENYYFLAFAGNGYAYGESEATQFTIPNISPVVPCEPEENFINFIDTNFFGDFNIQSVEYKQDDDDYEIRAQSPSFNIDVVFSKAPTSGIYTTTTSFFDLSKPRMALLRMGGSQSATTMEFEKVYVEKIGENKYNINLCDFEIIYIGDVRKVECNIMLE